ncbi:MAG: L,D-transpeptidase [Alkalilacustris sp.]
MSHNMVSRRRLLVLGGVALGGGLATPALAVTGEIVTEEDLNTQPSVRRNTQSFRTVRWQDHFDTLRHGAILCDVASRALHFWSEDESVYLVYPTSVPMTEEFTRRGRTEITLMRRDPVWIPTPNMRQRDPSLPERVEAGPDNPMGTRAMNLSWQFYRIHGIDNPAKVGRMASNGCFGLFNHHVEYLFERCRVGTQVVVI